MFIEKIKFGGHVETTSGKLAKGPTVLLNGGTTFALLQTILILAAVVILVVTAQNDGRYRPVRPLSTVEPRINDGRYRPRLDGNYRGGNDGRYIHQDSKYNHDDRRGGDYSDNSGRYKPDKSAGGAGGSGGSDGSSGSSASVVKPPPTPRRIVLSEVTAAPVVNLPKGKGSGEGGNGWRILRQEDEVDLNGYRYLYDTENGILAEEAGRVEKLTEDDGLRSQGFFEYTGDDGNLYRVDYVADDNGFVPKGDHIPTTPPHVVKLLAYLAANAKK